MHALTLLWSQTLSSFDRMRVGAPTHPSLSTCVFPLIPCTCPVAPLLLFRRCPNPYAPSAPFLRRRITAATLHRAAFNVNLIYGHRCQLRHLLCFARGERCVDLPSNRKGRPLLNTSSCSFSGVVLLQNLR